MKTAEKPERFTNGQTTLKSFNSQEEAQAKFDKLVASKVKKGYVEKNSA
jgi:predicted DNA-binding WGR domain protein